MVGVVLRGRDRVEQGAEQRLHVGARLGRVEMDVHELRSLEDVERLAPQTIAGRRIVIVGAGYIGLEAAAVASQLGLDVTVLEMAPRVLARVTSPVMAEFYEAEHARHGVKIRCGAGLSALKGEDGKYLPEVLLDLDYWALMPL